MRTITCFGDQTSGTFLIIHSVSLTKNFVIVNVFNSVASSRVIGNRNFARKEELTIYETIAALTSNTTCPMPAILGDSTCTVLPFAKWQLWRQSTISLMHRDHLVGNRYFVPFFAFYTESVMLGLRFIRESTFYTQSVMLSPRFIPECVFCFVLYFPNHAVSVCFFLYLFSSEKF